MHETKSIIECSSLVLCKSGSWKWNIKEETISLSDGWKRMLGFTSEEIKDHISEWIERVKPEIYKFVPDDSTLCCNIQGPIMVQQQNLMTTIQQPSLQEYNKMLMILKLAKNIIEK